jgi:molybdate transport system regulatory protein
MDKKKIRIRCWVEIEGSRFFGPGPAELLEQIENTGSISRGAREMGMSYKKAWDIVDNLNSFSKDKFVQSQKGGINGGRAELTPYAKKVITQYQKLVKKLNAVIEKDDLLKVIK